MSSNNFIRRGGGGGGSGTEDDDDDDRRTGVGGSVPGAPDDGGDSDPSTDSSDDSDSSADGFRDELGGDPAESGGSNTGADEPSTGGSSDSGSDSSTSDPDDSDSGAGGFRDELGGDPAESGGSNTGADGSSTGSSNDSGSDSSTSNPDGSDSSAGGFRDELGGDPAESGGSNTGAGGTDSGGSDPAERYRDELGGDPAESGGSNTGAGAAPSDGSDPAERYRDELGGDPAESGGSNTGAGGGSSNDPGSLASEYGDRLGYDSGPGDGSAPGDGTASPDDETGFLEGMSQWYTEDVAEPFGENLADATPATQIEERLFGTNRSERFFEGTGTTLAQLVNIPGALVGLQEGAKAFDEASSEAYDPVVIGGVPTGVIVPDPEGQQEVGSNIVDFGAAAATRAQENPFRTGGSLFAGAVGGAVGSRGLSSALRRADGPDTGISDPVPTGRSDVGTGGRGPILDADAVDEARGITGPSRRTVVEGRVERALENTRDRLDDLGLDVDEFVSDERGQLQRRGGSRDSGGRDAPQDFDTSGDPTRPPGGGGTFEDVRQDSLTQTQDALRDQAERPNAGDFEPGPDPLAGSNRGPILDPDSGDVELQRTTGTSDTAEAVADSSGSGASASASGGASAGGSAAGLGELAEANDPTGIADIGITGTGTGLDPAELLGAGSSTTGTDAVDSTNDPTGISPELEAQLDDPRIGGGELPDQGSGANDDIGTLDETNDPTDVSPPDSMNDADTDTDTGVDIFDPSDTDIGPGTGGPSDTDTVTGTDTGTDTGSGTGTGTPTPPGFDDDGQQDPPGRRPPRDPGNPGGSGPSGMPRINFGLEDRSQEPAQTEQSVEVVDDTFDTGVPDSNELFGSLFDGEDDEEDLFPFDEEDESDDAFFGFSGGGSGSNSSADDVFEKLGL